MVYNYKWKEKLIKDFKGDFFKFEFKVCGYSSDPNIFHTSDYVFQHLTFSLSRKLSLLPHRTNVQGIDNVNR